ncbi:MAG: helix-turn-helix domain-containing protein [Desulfovibrionales bacterium]
MLLPSIPLKTLLPFAAYILWLLAFPMQGFLLDLAALDAPLFYFLIPHILSLALLVMFHNRLPLRTISRAALPLVCLLTPLTLLSEGYGHIGMIVTALLSPIFLVRAGVSLALFTNPVSAAGVALGVGNLLLLLLGWIPVPILWKLGLVTLLPLAGLIGRWEEKPAEAPPSGAFLQYLPFILVFYLVGGLMYAFAMPRYLQAGWTPGIELSFYILAVLAACPLYRRNPDLPLALGILSGMGAVSLFSGTSPLLINGAMFLLQMAFGFTDLFLIALMITSVRPVRSLSLGTGVMCAGILGGKTLVFLSGTLIEPIILTGNIILTIAVLILYFLDQGIRAQAHMPSPSTGAAHPEGIGREDGLQNDLPSWVTSRLSLQERSVLELVIAGKVFREVAQTMDISESTVKTYMRRIYEKLGVTGKKSLIKSMKTAASSDRKNHPTQEKDEG